MKGEPSDAALVADARLLPTTCDVATTEKVAAHVAEMREAVDEQCKAWHDGQPACWRQMREEYLEQKRLEGSFARGGRGVIGVGWGSISLGSIVTIGHGSGAGVATHVGGAKGATKASGTNNQVAGVDEADLVKTDGRFVYIASQGALHIIEASAT